MRIAVDAMGGDYAPGEIIKGAVDAAEEGLAEIILIGDETTLRQELHARNWPSSIKVVHASEVVAMGEAPVAALRRKKDSSINVATRLVKEKEADALISAGSTGAQMSAALLGLGRIKGIQRPAIATVLPTRGGGRLMLDVGANVDCKPYNLLQYGQMGSIYAEKVLQLKSPRVALLNIGTEPTKGNELTLAAYELLKNSNLNFTGNIEARDIAAGEADVIVCDGFVGNNLLKFGEGIISTLLGTLQTEMGRSFRSKLGASLLRPNLRSVKRAFEYDEFGGAPLLGVQGISIVCHGSSKAKAIKSAVRLAVQCVKNQFVEYISETVS